MKNQMAVKRGLINKLTRVASLGILASGMLLHSPTVYSQIGGGLIGNVGIGAQGKEDELRRLRDQLSVLQQQASGLDRDLREWDMRINDTRRELDRVQNDWRSSQRSLDQAQNDLRRLQDQIQQLERQVQEARQRKAQQLQQLSASLSQLQSQLSSAESRAQQADRDLSQLESRRNPGRISAIMAEIGALKTERDKLEAISKDYAARIEKMERECNSAECMIVLQTLRNEKKRADDGIFAIDRQYESKLPELNALQAIEAQVPGKVAERDRARAEVNNIRTSISSTESNIRNLQSQPIAEEGQLAQAQSRLGRAQADVSTWERNVMDLSRRSQQLDRDIRDQQMRREDVSRRLFAVQSQIQDVQRRIDELNSMPNRLVLAGSLLSSSQRSEILRSNVVLLSVESSSTPSSIRDSRSLDVVVLIDSVDVSRLQWGVFSSLEQVVKSGGVVTLMGSLNSLVAVSEADRLLSMCSQTVNTALGLKTVCH